MRSSSKMAKINSENNKNSQSSTNPAEQRYKEPSYSPYNSKQHLYIRPDQPVRRSDSQLQTQANIKLKDKRKNHLSALLESQKIKRLKHKEQENQPIDNNLAYIAQINALQRKKKARIYFLKRKEEFEASYKVGVPTKKGVEEQHGKVESDQTQSTNAGNTYKLQDQREQLGMEQMHYQMVRIQQNAKQIIHK